MSSGRHTQDLVELVLAEDRNETPLCERALVGALLIDGGMRAHCRDLTPGEFKDKPLGRVYEMLMDVDGPIDLVIAVDEAERRGLAKITGKAGIATYLASLLDLVPDVENTPDYASRVKRAAVVRKIEEMRSGRQWRTA